MSMHMCPLTLKDQGGFQVWESRGSRAKWVVEAMEGGAGGSEPLAFSTHTFVSDPTQDYSGKLTPLGLSFLFYRGIRVVCS